VAHTTLWSRPDRCCSSLESLLSFRSGCGGSVPSEGSAETGFRPAEAGRSALVELEGSSRCRSGRTGGALR
jgi:hypothetical protein